MRKVTEDRQTEEESEKKKATSVLSFGPNGQEGGRQNYDENASERLELKRFLKFEKEKIYTIDRISNKDPEYRT